MHRRSQSARRRREPRKLEKLLAGEDLAGQALEKFRQRIQEDEKGVDLQFSGEAQTATVQQAKPTPPAAKNEPVKLRLTSLWKCMAISTAGNILVTTNPAASPAST